MYSPDKKDTIYMHTIQLALIHNRQIDRLAVSRYLINQIHEFIGDICSVNTTEYGYQPEIIPFPFLKAYFRALHFENLQLEWKRYRLYRASIYSPSLLKWLIRFSTKCMIQQSFRQQISFRMTIDSFVAAKHILAWQMFVESNQDLLVVFEDDVVGRSDSLQRFKSLLEKHTFKLARSEKALYIDLAGGCTFEELQIDKLEVRNSEGLRHFSKVVSNTACGYLINQSLAKAFLARINRNPKYRLMAIDWAMNKMLIDLEKESFTAYCMHADPSIFIHGSCKGVYPNWR